MQSALRGGDLYELLKDRKGNRALLHPMASPETMLQCSWSGITESDIEERISHARFALRRACPKSNKSGKKQNDLIEVLLRRFVLGTKRGRQGQRRDCV